MQDHSTVIEPNPLNFTHKQVRIRRNLGAISQIDAKMRNDINAARRKLTNSVNSPHLREIHFQMMRGGQATNMRVQSTTNAHIAEGQYNGEDNRSNSVDKRIRELEQALRKARAETQYYKNEWQKLKNQMIDFERIKKEKEELILILNRQRQSGPKTINEGDRNILINELNIARTSIQTLKSQIQLLSEQNNVIKTKMTESVKVQDTSEEAKILAKQLEAIQQENSALNSALLDLKRSNENITLNMKAGGLQSNSEQILRLTHQFKQEKEVTQRRYKEEISSLQQRYKQIESQYINQHQKISSLEENNTQKDQTLKKLRIELETYKIEMGQINSNMARFQKLKKDNEQLMKMLSNQTQISQKNSSLQSQKQSLQFEVSSLRADVETLTIKTQRLEQENKYLKSKNTQNIAQIQEKNTSEQRAQRQLNIEVVSIREENTHLKTVINDLRQNIIELNSQNTNYINVDNSEVRRLTYQIDELKRDKQFTDNVHKDEIALFQKQKQSLLQERSANEQNIYNLEGKIRQLQRSLRDYEYKIQLSENQNKMQTETQIKSLKMNIQTLQTTINTLEQQNYYYKNKPKENVEPIRNYSHQQDLQRLQTRFTQQINEMRRDKQFTESTLRDEISVIQRQKQQLQQERSTNQEMIFNLESKLRTMERSLHQLQYKLELSKSELTMQMESQVSSSKMNIDTLKTTIKTLQQQNSYYKSRISDQPVQTYGHEEQIYRLKLQIDELKRQKESNENDHKSQMNMIKKHTKQLEDEKQSTQMRMFEIGSQVRSFEKLKRQYDALKLERDMQEERIKSSNSIIQQLEYSLQQAEQQIRRLSSMQSQSSYHSDYELQKLARDNQQLNHMLTSYQHFEHMTHQLENQKSGLKNELLQSRVNIENLQSTIFNLQEENKSYKIKINEVQAIVNHVKAQEINHLQNKLSEVERQKQNLNNQIVELKLYNEDLAHKIHSFSSLPQNQIQKLTNQLNEVTEQKQQTQRYQNEEINRLQQCMNELQRQYLIYQERATNVQVTIKQIQQLYRQSVEEAESLRKQLSERQNKQIQSRPNIELNQTEIDKNKLLSEIAHNKTVLSQLEAKFKSAEQERTFFESKLYEAEQYIQQCDQKLAQFEAASVPQQQPRKYQERINALQTELISVNESLLSAQKELQLVKSKQHLQDKVGQAPVDVFGELNFFKNKLTEAQNYIEFLEGEKGKIQIALRDTTIDNEKMQEQLKRLSHLLDEAQIQKNSLKEQISLLQKNQNSAQSIADQVNRLNIEIARYKSQKQQSQNTFKQKIVTLERKLQENEGQSSLQKQKLTILQNANKQLESSLQNLRIEAEKLKTNVKVNQDNQAYIQNLKRQKQQISAKLNTQTDLLQKINVLEKERQYYQTQFKTAMTKIHHLEEQICNMEEKLKVSSKIPSSNIHQITQQNQFLKSKLAEAEEYLFELENRLKSFQNHQERVSNESKVSDLANKITSLQIENKKIENRYSQIQQKQKQYVEKISTLQKQLNYINSVYRSSQDQIQQLRSTTQKYQRQQRERLALSNRTDGITNQDLKIKLNEAENYIAELQVEKNKIAKELQQLIAKTKKSEADLKRQSILLNQAENTNQSMEKIISQLKSNNKQLIEQFKQEKIQSDEELDGLKEEIGQLKISQANLRQQIKLREQKSKQLQMSLQVIKNENKQLVSQIQRETGSNKAELESLKRERDQLLIKLNSNNSASQSVATLQRNNQNLQDQVNSSKARINSLEVSKQTLQAEVSTFKAKINLLQSERRHIENERNETFTKIKHIQSEKYTLQRQISSIKNNIEASNKNIEALTKENNLLNDKLVQSETQINQLKQLTGQRQNNQPQLPAQQDLQFFKSKLIEAENYIGYLEQEKQQIEQMLKAAESNVKGMQQKLKHLTQQLDQAKKEKETLVETINQLNKRNEKILSDTNTRQIQNTYKQLQQLKTEREKSEQALRQQIINLKSAKEASERQVRIEKQKVEQVFEQKRKLEVQLQNIRTEYQTLQTRQNANLQTQIITITEQSNQRIAQIHRKQSEYISKINSLETDISTLREKLNLAQDNLIALRQEKNADTAVKELKDQEEQINEEDVEFFKKKLLEAESYIEFLEEEKYKLENQLETSTIKANKSQSETINLSRQLSQAKQDTSNLNSIVNDLKKDIKLLSDSRGTSNNEELMRQSQQISQLRRERQILQRQHQQHIDQLNRYKQELETRYSDSESRMRQLESIIAQSKDSSNLQEQSDYFKGKLLEAEGYIVELQKQLHDKQVELNNEKSTTILRDKIVELEGKNRQVEMNLILLIQKEKNYLDKISNLEERLSHATEELSEAEEQMGRESKKNEQIIQKLKAEIKKGSKDPETEIRFFKEKLLQAEAYISDLVKEKKDLQDKLSSGEGDRSEEIMKLTEEAVVNDAVIKQLQNENAGLTHQIRQLDIASKSKEEQIENMRAKLIHLQQKNESKGQVQQETVVEQQEVESIDFFKEKLYEAENFIKQLEQQNETTKKALLEMTIKLEKLDEEIARLKDKSVSEASRQIDQDASLMLKELSDANSKIVDLREENDMLNKKLATIRVQYKNNDSSQRENGDDVAFLKEKLYQAEAYIVDLEKDIQTLNQQSDEREEAIKNLESNIQTLSMQIVEAEATNKQLQQQLSEGKLQAEEKLILQKQKIEEDLSEKQRLVEQLTIKISKIAGGHEQNQSKYKQMIDEQAKQLGELMGKLSVKEETNISLTEKSQAYQTQISALNDKVKFFENKLLEAERYSTQLEQERDSTNEKYTSSTEVLRSTIQTLKDQLKTEEQTKLNLMKIIDEKQKKIEESSGYEQIIKQKQQEIERLHDENKDKNQFVQDLLEQVRRVSDENNKLSEQLMQTSPHKGDDSEQGQTKIQEEDKSRLRELQSQVESLVDQLRQLKGQLDQQHLKLQDKDKIIEHLKNELDESNSNAQRLAHKVAHLTHIELQFAEFKATVEANQQAQRELQELERDSSKEPEKNDISHSSSRKDGQSSSSVKNKHLEHSLQEANKELQNEMKEEAQSESKQLVKEIDYLKNILEESEEENRQLRKEQQSQLKAIQELSENNQLLNEQIVHFREMQQEIGKQVVLAEADNKKMQQQMQELQSIIKKQEESILSASQSINQGSEKQHEDPKSAIQEMNEALVQVTRQQLQHVRQNEILMQNLTTQIVEKDIKIKELQGLLAQQAVSEFPQAHSPAKGQYNQENLNILQLEEQLEQERQRMVMADCEIQMLKKNIQKLTDQRDSLIDKMTQYEEKVTQYEGKIGEYQLEMSKHKLLKMQSGISQNQDSESKPNEQEREQKLNSSIRRLISITSNEATGDPAEVLEQLEDFPYLNELITSILYRLRLSEAIDLEKGLKIDNQKKTIEQLVNRNEELEQENNRNRNNISLLKEQLTILRQTNQRIESELLIKFQEKRQASSGSLGENSGKEEQRQLSENLHVQSLLKESDDRYNELLKEVVQYEVNNNQLTEQLANLTDAHEQLKNKLKQYEHHISTLSTSEQWVISQQNFELRKKLEDSQRMRRDGAMDNSSSMGTHSILRLEFLNVCLERIDEIERQVQAVEDDLEHVATRQRPMMSTSQLKADDSQLVDRLQELEERLMRNATNIKEHQQKSDGELYGLLKELLDDEQVSQNSKKKIEDYLGQLEQQILKDHEEHQNEVQLLRAQIASNEKQQQGGYSDRSKDDLLRQINNLNNAVEIYHQETMRRKKVYRQNLEALLSEISQLHQQRPSDETGQMVRHVQEALDKEQEEDLQFEGDDFIIAGGSGHVQVLEGRGQGEGLRRLKEDVGELDEGQQQVDADRKPFLNFLLSAQDIDRQDLRLLRKKVAQLRGRQVDENLQLLKNNERRLEEVLQLANRETTPQQIQNIMLTLANNYSHDEISQIFGSEDADELINKLNQALCLEDSFYRGQNSSTMMNQIEQRKRKYYETPTKLSQEVFKHLILLLSAKKDEQFYEQIDSLFKSMYQIEDGFESALRKKDEVYKSHNERMNQIFNKSSSDNSQDYLAQFERGNGGVDVEARVQSERKVKKQQSEEQEREA